jgi:hypothetical protein
MKMQSKRNFVLAILVSGIVILGNRALAEGWPGCPAGVSNNGDPSKDMSCGDWVNWTRGGGNDVVTIWNLFVKAGGKPNPKGIPANGYQSQNARYDVFRTLLIPSLMPPPKFAKDIVPADVAAAWIALAKINNVAWMKLMGVDPTLAANNLIMTKVWMPIQQQKVVTAKAAVETAYANWQADDKNMGKEATYWAAVRELAKWQGNVDAGNELIQNKGNWP